MKTAQKPAASGNDRKPADGFFNTAIYSEQEGKWHYLKGIPLDADKPIDAAILSLDKEIQINGEDVTLLEWLQSKGYVKMWVKKINHDRQVSFIPEGTPVEESAEQTANAA